MNFTHIHYFCPPNSNFYFCLPNNFVYQQHSITTQTHTQICHAFWGEEYQVHANYRQQATLYFQSAVSVQNMPEACNVTQYSPEINLYAYHTREMQNKGKHASRFSWVCTNLMGITISPRSIYHESTYHSSTYRQIRHTYLRVLLDKNNRQLQYRRAMVHSIGEEGVEYRGGRCGV